MPLNGEKTETIYSSCLYEIEIQIFKQYGYLIGRENRLDT